MSKVFVKGYYSKGGTCMNASVDELVGWTNREVERRIEGLISSCAKVLLPSMSHDWEGRSAIWRCGQPWDDARKLEPG